MKKRYITTSLLLLASLLLGGCSEKNNDSAPTADTSSTSVSSTEPSQPESSTEYKNSTAESSAQSSTESVPESIPETASEPVTPVPVEFTDEDLELQKILSELAKPAHEIHSWLIELIPSAPFTEFKFPQLGDNNSRYYGVIPENCYWTDPEFTIPTTCAGMEELMLKYFSEYRTEGFMNNIVPGNLTENPDGTFDVTFDDEILTKLYVINDMGNFYIRPRFIEADGKFYRAEGSSIRVLTIIEDSAKVIIRTEDTIVFSHINGLALYGSDPEPDYNTEPFYSENAVKGVLKYERGGWKIDSWEE